MQEISLGGMLGQQSSREQAIGLEVTDQIASFERGQAMQQHSRQLSMDTQQVRNVAALNELDRGTARLQEQTDAKASLRMQAIQYQQMEATKDQQHADVMAETRRRARERRSAKEIERRRLTLQNEQAATSQQMIRTQTAVSDRNLQLAAQADRQLNVQRGQLLSLQGQVQDEQMAVNFEKRELAADKQAHDHAVAIDQQRMRDSQRLLAQQRVQQTESEAAQQSRNDAQYARNLQAQTAANTAARDLRERQLEDKYR